jgi:hypothetical protein
MFTFKFLLGKRAYMKLETLVSCERHLEDILRGMFWPSTDFIQFLFNACPTS